jgi:hypothetical protein
VRRLAILLAALALLAGCGSDGGGDGGSRPGGTTTETQKDGDYGY